MYCINRDENDGYVQFFFLSIMDNNLHCDWPSDSDLSNNNSDKLSDYNSSVRYVSTTVPDADAKPDIPSTIHPSFLHQS